MSDDTDGLIAAIEREHGGTATFIGTELVTAMWQGLIACRASSRYTHLLERRDSRRCTRDWITRMEAGNRDRYIRL
jgi:hypothetical protein